MERTFKTHRPVKQNQESQKKPTHIQPWTNAQQGSQEHSTRTVSSIDNKRRQDPMNKLEFYLISLVSESKWVKDLNADTPKTIKLPKEKQIMQKVLDVGLAQFLGVDRRSTKAQTGHRSRIKQQNQQMERI